MKFTDLIPWRTREVSRRAGDDSMMSFRREMDRLFDNFFAEPFGWRNGDHSFTPAVDLNETDSTITVKAELPGLDENNVEILLDERTLTLRGEKKDETERQENGFDIKESTYGRFERLIPLPTEVDEDKVTAEYKKGVLTVSLPKTESAKKARKKIKVAS